jgi:hypothetical protein|tara:strand:+ start:536 stop:928 length:393 start_codon:yes stop_codon:yes gene_type:complete
MEYTLLNGTPIGRSVVVGSVRHGPSNYAELADNGDILEVAATPSRTATQTLDWGSGSVVGGKWQRWTLRNKTDAELMREVRGTRDDLLKETDWYALSDVTMSSDMTTYREALRDLPANVDLTNIVYPTKP